MHNTNHCCFYKHTAKNKTHKRIVSEIGRNCFYPCSRFVIPNLKQFKDKKQRASNICSYNGHFGQRS